MQKHGILIISSLWKGMDVPREVDKRLGTSHEHFLGLGGLVCFLAMSQSIIFVSNLRGGGEEDDDEAQEKV